MFAQYRRIKTFRTLVIIGVTALLSVSTAEAEFFGFANGGVADDKAGSLISVELGLVSGEFAGTDFQNISLRANCLLRDGLGIYADLSNATVGSTDDTAYGIGAYYALGKAFKFADSVALKGSLHNFELSRFSSGNFSAGCTGPVTVLDRYTLESVIDPGTCGTTGSPGSNSTETIRAISLQVLLSGKPLQSISTNSGPASWYVNVGSHTFNGSSIDAEIGLVTGLVFPISKGDVYGGIDIIDELSLGLGFRYFVN